jgi:uncharacterized protein
MQMIPQPPTCRKKSKVIPNLTEQPRIAARIVAQIATDIDARDAQVNAAVTLLDSGATVPFIARYRKEATGGLSDKQLRALEERLNYLRKLEERRLSIIARIDEQGELTSKLRQQLANASTRSELEDLYLPFKKKRKTKGRAAIEAGLMPLADALWQTPAQCPDTLATSFINIDAGITDSNIALDGAKYILMERFSEDAVLISKLRKLLADRAHLCARVVRGKETEGEKFRDYFEYNERLAKVPSHRALAMFRGRSDGILRLSLKLPESGNEFGDSACLEIIAAHTGFQHSARAADNWCEQVLSSTWKTKLSVHLEADLFAALRERADTEAIRVFASNLRDLLLAAPAGPICTMGLDPGYRSGVKVTVIDATGKVLAFDTIYPHPPQKQWRQSLATLSALCLAHQVDMLAIGNGTASRETDKLATELLKSIKDRQPGKVVVSESGASVYSASEIAEQEFPELDVTIRGAVSIARRLQDPLAELVKIDPKAIGVGQYQHDVSQAALARSLDATVEDCVNTVGVDLNTASAALLSRVAGLGNTLAGNIIQFRDQNGPFKDRRVLKKVPRLGPKAFEQSAGFLRISNGDNTLDASAVHPEAYPVVQRIIKQCGKSLNSLTGDSAFLKTIRAEEFTDANFGLPTVRDILLELDKPGRDPRPEFRAVKFSDGVEDIKDVVLNQILEGQVTNVTNFGAFVDIGVHQDGLVHISAMSEQFIKDPHQVVKAGDIVKVKIMSVDVQRNRIGLSMRLSDEAGNESQQDRQKRNTSSARTNLKVSTKRSAIARNSEPRPTGKRQVKSEKNVAPSALALQLQAALDQKK